jgi:hypothetical protein
MTKHPTKQSLSTPHQMADGYYVPIGIATGSKASIVELLRN